MRGATILKASDDKTKELNKHTLMAFSGEAGDTSMLYQTFAVKSDYWSMPFSTVCRIHSSQHPALLDAKWFGSGAISCRQLCSGRVGEELKVKKAIHGQLATGRHRSNHEFAKFVLARLFSCSGTCSICCSWLRSVWHPPSFRFGETCSCWSIGNPKLIYACRYYCLSILDKHHHSDIDFDQGLKILRMCTDELKRRLPIDFKGVRIQTTQNGIITTTKLIYCFLDVGESDRSEWHSRDRIWG